MAGRLINYCFPEFEWYYIEVANRAIVILTVLSVISGLSNNSQGAAIYSLISVAITIRTVRLKSPALLFELHWRTIPLYVVNVCSFLLYLLCVWINFDGRDIASRVLSGTIGIIQLIVVFPTMLLLLFLPVPPNCQLNGKHKNIGTISFEIPVLDRAANNNKDIENQNNDNTDTPSNTDVPHPGFDVITVQCWFPIQKPRSYGLIIDLIKNFFFPVSTALLWTSGHPDHQLRESQELLAAIAKNNGLYHSVVKHLSLARTNSVWQSKGFQLLASNPEETCTAPQNNEDNIANRNIKHPIAVYSHGLYGWRQIHHTCCENLASHGYIVFACDHAPDSTLARYSTGDRPSVPFGFQCPPDLSSLDERSFYISGLHRRLQDLRALFRFIINDIDTEQYYPELKDRLDLTRVSLWGHSYGGGTVSAMCSREEKEGLSKDIVAADFLNNDSKKIVLNAAVMLDSWMWPVPDKNRQSGLGNTAFLNLSAEKWPLGRYQSPFRDDLVKNTRNKSIHNNKTGSDSSTTQDSNNNTTTYSAQQYDMVIRRTDHQNYCDVYLMASQYILRQPSMLGHISAFAAARAIDNLTEAFFTATNIQRNKTVSLSSDIGSPLHSNNNDTTTANTTTVSDSPSTEQQLNTQSINNTTKSLLSYCSFTRSGEQICDEIAESVRISANNDCCPSLGQAGTALLPIAVQNFALEHIIAASAMPEYYFNYTAINQSTNKDEPNKS